MAGSSLICITASQKNNLRIGFIRTKFVHNSVVMKGKSNVYEEGNIHLNLKKDNLVYFRVWNSIFSRNKAKNGGVMFFFATEKNKFKINIKSSNFTRNEASQKAAVIFLEYLSENEISFVANTSHFVRNRASKRAGVMYVKGVDKNNVSIAFHFSSLLGNAVQAPGGSGGVMRVDHKQHNKVSLNVRSTLVSRNSVDYGGFLFIYSQKKGGGNNYYLIEIISSKMAHNSGKQRGSVFRLISREEGRCFFHIRASNFTMNSGAYGVFALYGQGPNRIHMLIRECHFNSNLAIRIYHKKLKRMIRGRGAVLAYTNKEEGNKLTINIDTCVFKRNIAPINGGVALFYSMPGNIIEVKIKNSFFIGNIAKYGGAIAVYIRGKDNRLISLSIFNSTFDGNKAQRRGSAVWFVLKEKQQQSRLYIKGSLFLHNRAEITSGAVGVLVEDDSVHYTRIISSIFQGNNAKFGSAISCNGNSMDIWRSIFKENTGSSVGDLYIYGTVSCKIIDSIFSSDKSSIINSVKQMNIRNTTLEMIDKVPRHNKKTIVVLKHKQGRLTITPPFSMTCPPNYVVEVDTRHLIVKNSTGEFRDLSQLTYIQATCNPCRGNVM